MVAMPDDMVRPPFGVKTDRNAKWRENRIWVRIEA